MLSRRMILTTGAATLAIAGIGYSARVLSRAPTSALAPWTQAGEGFGDPRLDALSYAILAPSPHNRQPWLVELNGADSLTLFCDLDRRLPHTDPPDRQTTIGLGCFLEVFRQAAAEQGLRADITAFPDGEPQPVLDNRPIAQVTLRRDETVEPDPLFGEALNRGTTRTPFGSTPVSAETLAELIALTDLPASGRLTVSLTETEDQVGPLKALAQSAWQVEASTDRTWMESVHLTRIGAREVDALPDGISLFGPQMEALSTLGFISRESMSQQGGSGHQASLDFYAGLIDSARAFAWLTSKDNSRATQLETGAAWARLSLAASRLNLGIHPLSQVLQEFPEMAELYQSFHQTLGIESPARVQGLFRLGYANRPRRSPRWPMQSRLIAV